MIRRQAKKPDEWRVVKKDGVTWHERDVGAFVLVFRKMDGCGDWCCEVWRREDRTKPLAAPLFFTDPVCWEEATSDLDDFVEVFEAVVEFLPTGDRSPVTTPRRV